MVSLRIVTSSPEETEKVGIKLGKKLDKEDIVLLIGELGSGKTTFVKGIAKAIGTKEDVSSPSFVIMNIYNGKKKIFHLDLYRINSINEIEFVYDFIREGIIIVEWGEKIKDEIDGKIIEVHFKILSENEREIIINAPWD
uniref:tRNA threonylcarbamoyladenosine biosynthesis protein TsaE n=1 Tax=candidate division WOR-3 bacterium TaxID=2052148 RepID=A0A7C4Y4K7_UNCW3